MMVFMRAVFPVLLMLIVSPALAGDWSSYENFRFGYRIDIPPDFIGQGESASGDGEVFLPREGIERLTVWGGIVAADDFSTHASQAMTEASESGWRLRDQASSPSWAGFSGTRNGMSFYAWTVALCAGTQYASFWFEYPVRDNAALDLVISRLTRSLRGTGMGAECP